MRMKRGALGWAFVEGAGPSSAKEEKDIPERGRPPKTDVPLRSNASGVGPMLERRPHHCTATDGMDSREAATAEREGVWPLSAQRQGD